MRNWIWLLFVISLTGCSQTNSRSSKPEVGLNEAESTPIHVVHRFGPLINRGNEPYSFNLPIRNQTSQTVRFDKIQTSCSCTSAELVKKEIPPGEETLLKVDLRLGERGDNQRFACNLHTDSGQAWQHEIVTTVYSLVEITPPVLMFGNVRGGEEVTKEFEIRTHSVASEEPPNMEGVGLPPNTGGIKVEVGTESKRMLDEKISQRVIPVRVKISPSTLPNLYFSVLSIRLNIGGKSEIRNFTVSWSVKDQYEVLPSQLFFDLNGKNNQKGEKLSRRVYIRRLDKSPLKILEASCAMKGIRCSIEDKSPGAFVNVELDPTTIVNDWGEVIVKTDYSEQSEIKIRFAISR
jgi:hypothetical protein